MRHQRVVRIDLDDKENIPNASKSKKARGNVANKKIRVAAKVPESI